MLCQGLMGAWQAGQAEGGELRVRGGGDAGAGAGMAAEVVVEAASVVGSSSAACARQSRSNISGRR